MTNAIKTVAFGEIMLRLSPPGFERFFQSPVLQATFGGGEANVAVSLAHFGLASYYVSRVPANPIGDSAIRALRAEGVRTEFVQRGGDRLGIYFAETGASQRASRVVYDRAGASVGAVTPGDIAWGDSRARTTTSRWWTASAAETALPRGSSTRSPPAARPSRPCDSRLLQAPSSRRSRVISIASPPPKWIGLRSAIGADGYRGERLGVVSEPEEQEFAIVGRPDKWSRAQPIRVFSRTRCTQSWS